MKSISPLLSLTRKAGGFHHFFPKADALNIPLYNHINLWRKTLSQQLDILIHSWPTQSTNPRQFAYIHAPCHIGRKVLIKHSRDIILGCLRSANPVSLLLSIRHARLHSCPDDGQLQPYGGAGTTGESRAAELRAHRGRQLLCARPAEHRRGEAGRGTQGHAASVPGRDRCERLAEGLLFRSGRLGLREVRKNLRLMNKRRKKYA